MIEQSGRGMIRLTPRGWWLAGLLGAAIVVGLLAALLSRGEFKGKYAIPELSTGGSAPVQQPAPPPVAVPRIVTPPVQTRPTTPPPMVAEQDAPIDATRDRDDDSARMARAIEKAARKALDRGEPVRWHKAGEEGYVVVSDIRDYGDHACRNVSATINRDDGPAESTSHLWCTTPDGDWAPAK